MDSVKNFIDSLIKSFKLVLFIDNLFEQDQQQQQQNIEFINITKKIQRINTNLIDLLKVYRLNERNYQITYLSELNEPLLGKKYLKSICSKIVIDQYPIIFLNGKYFGTYSDINKEHDEGTLYKLFTNNGVINIDHSSYFGTIETDLMEQKSIFTTEKGFIYSNFELNDEIDFEKVFKSSNCSSKVTLIPQVIGDDSTISWNNTIETDTSTDVKPNNRLCNDYLNNKIVDMNIAQNIINFDDKEAGLTHPHKILSVINSRLFKAEQAIQTKSYYIMNKRLYY